VNALGRDRTVDLAAITRAASREAGGVPAGLLGGYLPAVLDAASSGRRLSAAELAEYARSGEQAADGGVALRGLVDLYLSATWRLWRELPGDTGTPAALQAAGLAVLRAADDAVAAAAGGFERGYLSVARREEAERREFFEDLLSGRGGVADLLDRGERLGLRLVGPHQVMLAGSGGQGDAGSPAGIHIDAVVAEAAAPASSLVLSRHGRLVVIVGLADGEEAGTVARALARALARQAGRDAGAGRDTEAGRDAGAGRNAGTGGDTRTGGTAEAGEPGPPPWRIAIGRSYPGPSGVVRSYDEAEEALDVAQRLGLADPVVSAGDLLIYQVLLRDRAAITDLVRTLLTPLARARGGAGPLVATLAAYYAQGGVATAAAQDLHLSVRTVTYRLARIRELTGLDPARPADALALQVAVIGARMLDWPATRLDRE
jgi:PucR C-terminal helix-turn-helix domain/GGDEF-like domain